MSSELVVVWRVTEKCSLACPFCAYDRRLQRSRLAADLRQVLAFGETLSETQLTGGRDILVSWLGGEPFLWPDLIPVSKIFRHQFGLRVAVTTNGLALKSETVRQALISDFDQVTISIDGSGSAHDRLRGANGLFDSLRGIIRKLSEQAAQHNAPLLIRVNTILMHDNLLSFESLCSELAGWGVRELTFNILGGRDRPEFFPEHRINREDAAWISAELPRIRRDIAGLGMDIKGSASYLERITQLSQGSVYPVEDCAPGKDFLFVDEQGMAAPCHFSVHGYGISIGELCSPEDLQNLPGRFMELKQKHTLAACLDCHSTQVFGKFEGFQHAVTTGVTV